MTSQNCVKISQLYDLFSAKMRAQQRPFGRCCFSQLFCWCRNLMSSSSSVGNIFSPVKLVNKSSATATRLTKDEKTVDYFSQMDLAVLRLQSSV